MLLWWPFYEWPFNNHHETSSIIITINNYYCYCYYYNCCCCCCRWWYLLLGLLVLRRYFWSVLQGGTNVITKCDKCHYKVQQVLLESATSVITKCDKCHYKVRQVSLQSATSVITKCDKCYYKVRQVLLQSATSVITKCDDYYKVRQYTVNEVRSNPTWWLPLKKLPYDLKYHRQHGLIKQMYFDKSFLEINNHIPIPANFFWVKCVRFSPCHDCLIRKRPSVFRGFPIIFRNLLNFTENSRKCSDDLWALRKTRQL